MKCYDHDFVIINTNTFKVCLPFKFWLFLLMDRSFHFVDPNLKLFYDYFSVTSMLGKVFCCREKIDNNCILL